MVDFYPVAAVPADTAISGMIIGDEQALGVEAGLDTYDCSSLPRGSDVVARNDYAKFCDGVVDDTSNLSEADQRIVAAVVAQLQAAARAEAEAEAARKAAAEAAREAEIRARAAATPAKKAPECDQACVDRKRNWDMINRDRDRD